MSEWLWAAVLTAALTVLLAFGFLLGKMQVQQNCDELGKFEFKNVVYTCVREVE